MQGSLQEELDTIAAGPDWGVHAVDAVLAWADAAGCSDVHIASRRDELLIRGRVHGALAPVARVPVAQRELVVSRLKVLARLPAFKKNEPQDGRMEFAGGDGQPRLLRLSFLPTIHGENVVIRFPREDRAGNRALHELGMTHDMLETTGRLLLQPEGALLLTGPSSSGKTTTMYAMLDWLNSQHPDRFNILTIEDPVERDLGFAGQVQVNQAQELTFDRALRSALRQDPNVLMVGEIRDVETARVTMQAGMSGHLVISTLHAGRASLVFSRLLSMGIEPFLVASAVNGALAQRLVRRVCGACNGDGCPACNNTGRAGRVALFECCQVTEALRELILTAALPSRVAEEAARSQTSNLHDEATRLAAEGIISPEELTFLFAAEEKA